MNNYINIAIKLISNDSKISKEAPPDWEEKNWTLIINKPYKERLIIAHALIAAEIDRMVQNEDNECF